jgi:hypothetical protein
VTLAARYPPEQGVDSVEAGFLSCSRGSLVLLCTLEIMIWDGQKLELTIEDVINGVECLAEGRQWSVRPVTAAEKKRLLFDTGH